MPIEKDERLVELRKESPEFAFHTIIEYENEVYGYVWSGPSTGRCRSYERIDGSWKFYSGNMIPFLKTKGASNFRADLRNALIDLDTYDNDAACAAGDHNNWTARRLRAILSNYGLKGDETPRVKAWIEVIQKALNEVQAELKG